MLEISNKNEKVEMAPDEVLYRFTDRKGVARLVKASLSESIDELDVKHGNTIVVQM